MPEKRENFFKYFENLYGTASVDCTCDNCSEKETCKSAYDIYNSDGDCLEAK